jgi:hypothetical protein
MSWVETAVCSTFPPEADPPSAGNIQHATLNVQVAGGSGALAVVFRGFSFGAIACFPVGG